MIKADNTFLVVGLLPLWALCSRVASNASFLGDAPERAVIIVELEVVC